MLTASVLGKRSICTALRRLHDGAVIGCRHLHSSVNRGAGGRARSTRSEGRRSRKEEPSLIEQLFPEESRQHEAKSAPREIPRLPLEPAPLPWRSAADNADARPDDVQKPSHPNHARAYEIAQSATSYLLLRNASKHLTIQDFRRLIPQGKHIEGWALEQGDIVQIIPGRNLRTLEANGLYVLKFSSPISAFAYQGHVTRIAKLVADQTPTSLFSGMPPQPSYILDGMDVRAAIEAYTLKPATQRLTLRQLKPPLSRAIAPQVRFGGHPALTQRPGKMSFGLRLTLDGPQLALRRIRHVIYESGRARALSWSGGEEMNVPISEWVAPIRYGELGSAIGESTKSESEGNGVVESEEAAEEESEHTSEQYKAAELKRRKPHPVFILGFHTEHAAQSFKRYWHRRPMEWEGDHADEEGDLPPIANVELLWLGEVVLVLQDKRELTVLSHLLTHASTTFRALLGPHFAEGQQERSATQLLRLLLPDDDSEGMLDLCAILHLKPLHNVQNSGEQMAAIVRILGLAMHADKYDCTSSIELAANGLLSRFIQPGGTTGLVMGSLSDLVLTAHLLRLPRHFAVFTSRLVMDYDWRYSTLLEEPVIERLGTALVVHLDEQRNAARKKCIDLIESLGKKWCCMASSTSSSMHTFAVTKHHNNPSEGLYHTLHSCSLSQTLSRLAKSDIVSCGLACDHGPSRTAINQEKYEALASDVKDVAHGLCLDCVTAAPGKCTHQSILMRYIRENVGA
nr:hypothetical protein B0A51_06774 [Rachicladosporium sp. CCFEE 5018]